MALASLNFLAESITMFPFRSSRPSVLCLSNKGNHRDTRLWEGEKTNIFTVALSTSSSHIFSSHSNLSNNTKWLKMAMTRCKVGRRNLGWPCARRDPILGRITVHVLVGWDEIRNGWDGSHLSPSQTPTNFFDTSLLLYRKEMYTNHDPVNFWDSG